MFSLILLFIFLSAPSTFCTLVTLENGMRGTVYKEISINQLSVLTCKFRRETASSQPADIQWLYTGVGLVKQSIIVHNNGLQKRYSETYTFLPPSSLQINSAKVENAGVYECRVLISDEDVDHGFYNLTVLVPPAEPKCEFPTDFTLTIGFSAEFKCHSEEGIPSPNYEWHKDKILLPLDSQQDKRYKNASFSYSTHVGTLKFSEVKPADAGTYFCRARNKVGSEQCHAVAITTSSQDIGRIVGIAFGVIFAILLLGILLWWSWKEGYWQDCFRTDGASGIDGDDGNDVMLDSHGPMVNKPTGRYNGPRRKQEASMII